MQSKSLTERVGYPSHGTRRTGTTGTARSPRDGVWCIGCSLDLVQLTADDNEKKLRKLTLDHGCVLAERDQARNALAEVETQLADTLAALKEVEGKFQAAQIKLAAAPAQVKQLPASSQPYTSDSRHSKRARSSVTGGPSPEDEEAEWKRFNKMTRPGCGELIAQFLQYHQETDLKGTEGPVIMCPDKTSLWADELCSTSPDKVLGRFLPSRGFEVPQS
ncbi:hypothetical protein B0H11DRAFT_2272400 [Mycena galericulata]|nr:hypothetical protein B0H11DRAFT_2272400 [Mycena galericulata]